jgi:hypothetical protein
MEFTIDAFLHNGRGQRPEGEHREPPVRWTTWFGRSCFTSARMSGLLELTDETLQ